MYDFIVILDKILLASGAFLVFSLVLGCLVGRGLRGAIGRVPGFATDDTDEALGDTARLVTEGSQQLNPPDSFAY